MNIFRKVETRLESAPSCVAIEGVIKYKQFSVYGQTAIYVCVLSIVEQTTLLVSKYLGRKRECGVDRVSCCTRN